MALFKISKGTSQNLPSILTEGFCWYTYDDSKFYIDHKDENGNLVRKALNAKEAEKLVGYDISTILNSSDIEIPTSKAVLDAIESSVSGLATEEYVDEAIASIPTQDVTGFATEEYVNSAVEEAKSEASNQDIVVLAEAQKSINGVQTTLDTHTENEDIHVSSHAKAIWDTAGEHALSSHARVDATSAVSSSINGNIVINDVETTVYSHPNSGVSAGTYKSVTVNAQGHITGGSNPTTLAGYGITDAEAKGTVSTHNSATNAHSDIRKSISDVSNLVGTTAVADQISAAIGNTTADDFGIYVQAQEPTDAVAGDIWIDTANDPTYIPPTIPEITEADNGKVLMVVNGKLQLVNLNLSVDANGVLTM
jgi:phage-related tail fiber protein